jgi:hypothetical protein
VFSIRCRCRCLLAASASVLHAPMRIQHRHHIALGCFLGRQAGRQAGRHQSSSPCPHTCSLSVSQLHAARYHAWSVRASIHTLHDGIGSITIIICNWNVRNGTLHCSVVYTARTVQRLVPNQERSSSVRESERAVPRRRYAALLARTLPLCCCTVQSATTSERVYVSGSGETFTT